VQSSCRGCSCGSVYNNKSIADTDFESYLVHVRLTAADRAVLNLGAVICGRPESEGCMFCKKYGMKLHLILKPHSSGQEVINHELVDGSASRSTDENANLYNDHQIIW
jgi:hypothetical protein